MPGVEPVRKRNSSLREITVRRDSGRPPDTDERVEQMARLIAGPVPCWCPDDWREPFDKAACPLHGGQEWPAGFHRERVREFLATDAPSPSPPEPAPDVDAIIDRLEASAFGVHAATHVRLEDAVAAVREAASPSGSPIAQAPPSPDENGWCPTCAATPAPASPDERLREAGDLAPNEGVWPDQSAMHGVLLEQVKDAYTEGITDTVAKLRVRAANMLPEVASFTMDEIEAILGHAAPGICCAPHCWSEYGTPCGDCPADAEGERQSDE